MNRGSHVEISRQKSDPTTQCENCDRLNPEATRERARQHAAKTGHIVHVLIEDVTTYKPKEQT